MAEWPYLYDSGFDACSLDCAAGDRDPDLDSVDTISMSDAACRSRAPEFQYHRSATHPGQDNFVERKAVGSLPVFIVDGMSRGAARERV